MTYLCVIDEEIVQNVMGSFGIGLDYTVRLKLRLRDKIDESFLMEAVEKTQPIFMMTKHIFDDKII